MFYLRRPSFRRQLCWTHGRTSQTDSPVHGQENAGRLLDLKRDFGRKQRSDRSNDKIRDAK